MVLSGHHRQSSMNLPALIEDSWPVEEPPRMEEGEGQLIASHKSWIHPMFAR